MDIRYPVGTRLISLTDEIDDDEDSVERITPAGSEWEVTGLEQHPIDDARHIGCPATGAWVVPNVEQLDRDFRVKGAARDPRADSPEKLEPPHPLPHISRKALARVTSVLPPPVHCRYCTAPVKLIDNAEIYRGISYGKWPYVYRCDDCDAHVGLHPDTDLPLGILANSSLRAARKANKPHFHTLQKVKGWKRKTAYAWLAERLSIPVEHCHWAWFDIEQCQRAGEICRIELEDNDG